MYVYSVQNKCQAGQCKFAGMLGVVNEISGKPAMQHCVCVRSHNMHRYGVLALSMHSVLDWGNTVFVDMVIQAQAQAEASVHAWLVCQVSVLMKLAILFSDMPMHMCCNNCMSHNEQRQKGEVEWTSCAQIFLKQLDEGTDSSCPLTDDPPMSVTSNFLMCESVSLYLVNPAPGQS